MTRPAPALPDPALRSGPRTSIATLWRLLDRRRASLLAALSAASAVTEGVGLVLLVPMLDVLGRGSAPPGLAGRWFERLGVPNTLLPLLGLFVLLVLLRGALNVGRVLTAQAVEVALTDGLRRRAWNALLHCDWRTLSSLRKSDNASLLISSLDRVSSGAHYLISAAIAAVTLAGIALAAVAISPLTALLATVGGGLALLAYRGLRRRGAELGEALNHAYARIHGEVGEGLAALRVIKSFGAEGPFEARLNGEFATLRHGEREYVRSLALGQWLLQGSGAIVLALVVWAAVALWQTPVVAILPMVVLFARALPLLGALQEAWQHWIHARPALDETLALLALTEAAREPELPPGTPIPQARETIRVEQVTVRHQGRMAPALDAIDLELRRGTITALIGPSGAGKSTLADVLGGLIAPDDGALVIDGVALDSAMRSAWRRQVTYVQQEPVLFTGTVRDNLLLSDPQALTSDLTAALRRASADFVERLPDGLDTAVGEGGRDLSGGERQRIALARALLRHPKLLILDEATSALDSDNEAAIARAILGMREEMAILIIGHRGALAEIADHTVQIAGGKLRA